MCNTKARASADDVSVGGSWCGGLSKNSSGVGRQARREGARWCGDGSVTGWFVRSELSRRGQRSGREKSRAGWSRRCGRGTARYGGLRRGEMQGCDIQNGARRQWRGGSASFELRVGRVVRRVVGRRVTVCRCEVGEGCGDGVINADKDKTAQHKMRRRSVGGWMESFCHCSGSMNPPTSGGQAMSSRESWDQEPL